MAPRIHTIFLALTLAGCGVGELMVQPASPDADVPVDGGSNPSTPDASTTCAQRLELVGAAQVSVAVQQQVELTALVRDTCTGPLSGATVSFTAVGLPSGAQVAPSAVTDGAGLARAIVTAGATAGSFDVTARHGAASVTFSITITGAVNPCAGHCANGKNDCGETGLDCGGADCAACPVATTDDAVIVSQAISATLVCSATTSGTVTVRNSGTTTWTSAGGYQLGYVGDAAAPLLPTGAQPRVDLPQTVAPGATVTFSVALKAPAIPASYDARFQMVRTAFFGAIGSSRVNVTPGCSVTTGCSFPQGVPDADFTGHTNTSTSVGNVVNQVMAQLSGCNPGSDCYIGDRYTDQTWFAAVTAALRARGLCAGQHEVGYTDEIAVSDTGCTGLWYGYHVFNYGGLKVVWSPGASRGAWSITPSRCPPP